MTDTHILLLGPPPTEAALGAIQAMLVDAGCTVEVHVGTVQGITSSALWQKAAVAMLIDGVCGAIEMDAAPVLHTIIVPTLGYDGIDVDAASARGIAVANGQVPEHAESVAEAAVMFMLMSLYDVDDARTQLKHGKVWYGVGRTARMLRSATVGVIGYGKIARAVIDRVRAFGATVLVHNRTVPDTQPEGVRFVSLDELLTQSDIVVPMVSLTPETRHLLDADRLATLKPGAVLVNLGRGALVDQDALVSLANAGKLRLALDVFETEPLPLADAIRDVPAAILTPHAIAQTSEGQQAMRGRALENTRRSAKGLLPDTPLNIEALGDWPRRLDADIEGEVR